MLFNRILLILTLSSLSSLSAQLWAGDVDIQLTTDFDFSRTFVKGQQGTFSLTVTNHGPDRTGSNSSLEYSVYAGTEGIPLQNTGEISIIYSLNEQSINDCLFTVIFGEPLPGNPLLIFFGVLLLNLDPGQSGTCMVDFQVFEETSHQWLAVGLNDNELDSSDNEMIFGYPFKAIQVPTLSKVSLMILALLNLLLAYFKYGKTSRRFFQT